MDGDDENYINGIRSRSSTFLYDGGRPNQSEGEGITKVIVKKGVKTISDFAFQHWESLQIVYVVDGVITIGEGAFHVCKALTYISLPESLERIGDGAFNHCVNLEKIHLPNNIHEMGEYAVTCCSSLLEVELPLSLKTIAPYSFSMCTMLSKVRIPQSILSVEKDAFVACKSLILIQLHNGIINIDSWAFYKCESLRSIQIPISTEMIHDCAFESCISLKIVYIPSRSIVDGAEDVFTDCNSDMILLTDAQDWHYNSKAALSLHDIEECLHHLPNNIPLSQQMQTLHSAFQLCYPEIAQQAQHSNFNLLHLLIYFPGDIYHSLLDLLKKCPQCTSTVDNTGRTAFHHVVTSTRHNMDLRSYNLLLQHTPDKVVHLSIRSKSPWIETLDVVKAKISSLSVKDEESGMLLFMIAAEENNHLGLTAVYELLCMQPDVLKLYHV